MAVLSHLLQQRHAFYRGLLAVEVLALVGLRGLQQAPRLVSVVYLVISGVGVLAGFPPAPPQPPPANGKRRNAPSPRAPFRKSSAATAASGHLLDPGRSHGAGLAGRTGDQPQHGRAVERAPSVGVAQPDAGARPGGLQPADPWACPTRWHRPMPRPCYLRLLQPHRQRGDHDRGPALCGHPDCRGAGKTQGAGQSEGGGHAEQTRCRPGS